MSWFKRAPVVEQRITESLRDELEGLPEMVQIAAARQLAQCIREATRVMTLGDPTLHHLQCELVCGRIAGVVDFVRKFRIVQDEANEDSAAAKT